jgi:predicted DNA-binding transcriptional regulator
LSADSGAKSKYEPLSGTTYRVYKFIFKASKPVGIYDIQRGLNLSSPSVAQYHTKKLLQLGLIREEPEGYVVDKNVFENVVRIRRTAIPLQVAYVGFFAVLLGSLLTVLRPQTITSIYFVALVSSVVALVIFVQQTIHTLRRVG